MGACREPAACAGQPGGAAALGDQDMGAAVPALDARMIPTAGRKEPRGGGGGGGGGGGISVNACTQHPHRMQRRGCWAWLAARRPESLATHAASIQPAQRLCTAWRLAPASSRGRTRRRAAPPLRTDQAVQRQRLGENQDEDHAHKQLGLLRVGAHAGVAHDADRHPRAQACQPARQARRKVGVAVEKVVGLVLGLVDCRVGVARGGGRDRMGRRRLSMGGSSGVGRGTGGGVGCACSGQRLAKEAEAGTQAL